MKTYDAELIFHNDSELLEGPCWDENSSLLYFVSIKGDIVFCLNPETDEIKSYTTDGNVGCAVIKNGKLITAERSGIYERSLDDTNKKFLLNVYEGDDFRYNDGKLDPCGRLFVGTIGFNKRMENKCALYRIDSDNSYKTMVDGVTVSNGLGWTKDGNTMFYIDTPTHEVWKYDYDQTIGEMSNKTVFCKIDDGVPDGMCVDIDDTIWVAHWGGGKVSHWDTKTGQRIGEILLPLTNASSCCVGGENLDTLFITTAKCDGKDEPSAGGLFKVKIR